MASLLPVNSHVGFHAFSSHFIIHPKCASQAQASSTWTHGMSSELYGCFVQQIYSQKSVRRNAQAQQAPYPVSEHRFFPVLLR
jgi:hypothetical protein